MTLVLLALLVDLPALAAADDLLRERLTGLRPQVSPVVAGVRLSDPGLIDEFYLGRGYEHAWIDTAQVAGLKALAERSREHGLRPDDFNLEAIEALAGSGGAAALAGPSRADAEILLTDSLLRIIRYHGYGKVDPQALDSSWNHADGPDPARLIRDLERALAGPDLAAEVTAMWRRPDFYRRLQDGLARYRELAAAGGWPRIPEGGLLKPGMSDSRLPAIRERLRITGDYRGGEPADPARYDPGLERAVKTFQQRHTLGVDGIIGPATLAAMNTSAEQRVAQIRANLERMRWVGGDVSGDFLLVDIAGQEVALYRDGQLAWASRAIVGRPERQTPVFRDRIEYLELNPTWTVPPTILKEDILPKARKNPNAVRKKGLEIIDRSGNKVAPEAVDWSVSYNNLPYMLRQPPGPRNALGEVKFMFPNRHSVYLHDTPDRGLFSKPQRTFSSGCVRVERPLELAELLLDDREWDRARFESLIGTRRPTTVHLKEPIPVVLYYWTAEADEQGVVRFREDIYGRDAAVLAALDERGSMRLVQGEDGGTGPGNAGADRTGTAPVGGSARATGPAGGDEMVTERVEPGPGRVDGVVTGPEPSVADTSSGTETERSTRLTPEPPTPLPRRASNPNGRPDSRPEQVAESGPKPRARPINDYGTDLPGEGPLFSF